MTDSQILTWVLGMLGVISVVAIIYYVIMVIAQWRIFTKAGEKGWKAIIPVLNVYVLYKISWRPQIFWILIALEIIMGVCSAFTDSMLAAIITFMVSVAITVIGIIQYSKLSKAYGHGAGFTLGLIFLNPIFMLILGFGSSQYIGKQD